MLRKIRITLAALCFTAVTLLFLDFTGTLHAWLGWTAKIQFLPALLAMNFAVVALLVAVTLLFGRVYCSVICPLGVMQDLFAAAGRKARKNRYSYSPALTWLRWLMLLVFAGAMLAGGSLLIHKAALLLAPYSTFGRIVSTIFAPLWLLANNALAYIAERADSYAFYSVDVWLKSGSALAVSLAMFLLIGILAWRNGRTWCNTVCPVGTVLGFLSQWSLIRPVIDTSKCNGCGLCARNCKAACIDPQEHKIDYSRCVACMDCLDKCRQGAMIYEPRHITRAMERAEKIAAEKAAENATENAASEKPAADGSSMSRRTFLTVTAAMAATAAVRAQEKHVDGGLAVIEDKKIPERATRIVPAGSQSLRNFSAHCTACQLCVSVCPNNVLRPSSRAESLLQPEMSYERGYCRPECTKCAEVCPAGAVRKIDKADKASTQIGHAVWVPENCVPLRDGVNCGNCARHCPSGAITMVRREADNPSSPLIPAINTERCIGCGACENLCPARPLGAIYVEGHEQHRTI